MDEKLNELLSLLPKGMPELVLSTPENERAYWFAIGYYIKSLPKEERKAFVNSISMAELALKINPDLSEYEAYTEICKRYPILRESPYIKKILDSTNDK